MVLYVVNEKIKIFNFGISRGNKIRDILESVGIFCEKFVVKFMIKDFNYDENGVFLYGIFFIFKLLDIVRFNFLKFKLLEDKIIYLKLVNNDIFVNDVLKELLEEVKIVFFFNFNVRVEIVGYIDNIGNVNDNYVFVLKYLC